MSKAALLAFALVLLQACLKEEELTSRTTGSAQVEGPDCASCHAYPLTDTNHAFHLYKAGRVKRVNGEITCFDCHSTAIAHQAVRVPDSIFSDGLNEFASLDYPDDPVIRTYTLVRVDSVDQEHPLRAPVRPGRPPLFQEYITSLAHMNGKVDVSFPRRSTDTSQFPGLRAEFFPEKETCSAVACHPTVDTPYWRFADSARGLRELTGQAGDLP